MAGVLLERIKGEKAQREKVKVKRKAYNRIKHFHSAYQKKI